MYGSMPPSPYQRPRNTGPMKPRPTGMPLPGAQVQRPMDYNHPLGGQRPVPQAPASRPVAHIPERPMPNPNLGGGVGPMTPRPPHMPGPVRQDPRIAQKQAYVRQLMETKQKLYGHGRGGPAEHQMMHNGPARGILQTHDPRLAQKQAMIRLMQQQQASHHRFR